MSRQRADPTLGVGMIGCGSVALDAHIPALLELGSQFRVMAIAEPIETLRRQAQRRLGLSAVDTYEAPEPLLARTDVDLVDVCTPPNVRRDIVLAAVAAGKHVLCEKPLAIVPRDAAEMVGAARAAGLTLGLVHNYAFRDEFALARAIIDSGEIGNVRVAILNYLGVQDNPGNPDYLPGWRRQAGISGGGVLMDMLHAVYLCELLLGATIRRVSAYVVASQEGSPVEDLALCRFECDTGAALVNVGWGVGPGGVELGATDGRLVIHYDKDGTSPFFAPERMLVVGRTGQHEKALTETSADHRRALADFGAAVLERRQPAATGEDGQRVLEAVLAAYQSALLERTVAIPLAQDDPVYLHGVAGLRMLAGAPAGALLRRGVFGLGKVSSQSRLAVPSVGSGL